MSISHTCFCHSDQFMATMLEKFGGCSFWHSKVLCSSGSYNLSVLYFCSDPWALVTSAWFLIQFTTTFSGMAQTSHYGCFLRQSCASDMPASDLMEVCSSLRFLFPDNSNLCQVNIRLVRTIVLLQSSQDTFHIPIRHNGNRWNDDFFSKGMELKVEGENQLQKLFSDSLAWVL